MQDGDGDAGVDTVADMGTTRWARPRQGRARCSGRGMGRGMGRNV